MKRLLASAAMALAFGAASTFAHHPFDAEYDWKKPMTVTGTVTKFEWKAPHSMLEIKGKDGLWTVELGEPAQLRQVGWTQTQFRSGEQITVDGWQARDGSKKLSGKSVKTAAGKELFAEGAFFEAEAQAQAATGASRETTPTSGSKPTPKPTR